MKLLLSIVIPTLNEEKYLPLLLGDLVAQTNKSFEVVIVDGNSEDKTVQEAQRFRQRLKMHVIKVARRNLSYQRNIGGSKARGEYLLVLDADTRVEPTFIETLTLEILKDRALIYLPTILPINTKILYRVLFKISNIFVLVSQYWDRPFPTQAAMVFKRDFFMALGGYTVHASQDKKKFFPDDHDIIHRAKKEGVKAKVLRLVFVKVSQRRFDRNSELKTFFTYAFSAIHMTVSGKVDNSKIDYEMGGHMYGKE